MNQLFCGHNMEILADPSLIPSDSVRLCFTSPPYPGFKRDILKSMEKGGGAGYTYGGKDNFEMMKEKDYVVALCRLFKAMERVMLPFGTLMLNINSPTDENYCRTLLSMLVAISVREHTNWVFYEHNIWYNIVAPTAAFPYRLKPTWEHVFQFQYIPDGEKGLKKKYKGKSWNSQIVFNKAALKTEFETRWTTQKRKLASKQDRKFSQSGHNIEAAGLFKGEGKDLENVFFFANTRNSETERATAYICPDCGAIELVFGRRIQDLTKFQGGDRAPQCRCGGDAKHIGHGAVFPEALAKAIIMGWSNPGDVVIDPFLGSGTLAIVASQLNRKYIGIDINPDYIRLSEEKLRLANKVRQEELF